MTTYYMDTAGSNTSPYDTWAKSATDLQTLIDLWAAGDIVYARGTQTIDASTYANGLTDASMAPGDTTTGPVQVIGCDASGTARAGQFTLQGDSGDKPTSCMYIAAGNMDHIHWHNVTFDGTNVTSHAFQTITTGNNDYCLFRKCIFENSPATGCYYDRSGIAVRFIQCVFTGNTTHGLHNASTGALYAFCRFGLNGDNGSFAYDVLSTYYGCLFYDNNGEDLDCDQANTIILNCVLDGTTSGTTSDGIKTRGGKLGICVIGCRITNHAVAGKAGFRGGQANDGSMIEDWNVFYGNTADLVFVDFPGFYSYNTDSTLGAPGDDGYTPPDFNVIDGKEIDSTEIDLFWDA